MLDSNDRELVKQINQITRSSPLFEKFNQLKSKSPKGYTEHETVTFQLARLLTCYQFYDPQFFDQDFSHKVALFVLNQAFHQGFSSYWLDEQLFDAFSNTHLPKNILEFKRVIPVGLLFLPHKLKNPDGQFLKWIFFYHHLAEDEVLPISLHDTRLQFETKPFNSLNWLTILDDGSQYGDSRSLKIEEHQLSCETGEVYINQFLEYDGKNIDTKTEQDFSDKVTELLIQTLLYLQLKPEELNPVDSPQASHRSKAVSKKQKLAPIMIGKNYQVKTQRSNRAEPTSQKSPITHWRRGFYRWQPYGPRTNAKYRIVWIEPVLVN